jgi:hypothetical protein
VLRCYELPTDEQNLPGQRFYDKRGEAMWSTINGLMAKLQEQSA